MPGTASYEIMGRFQLAAVQLILILVEEMFDDHGKQLFPIVSESVDEPIIAV